MKTKQVSQKWLIISLVAFLLAGFNFNALAQCSQCNTTNCGTAASATGDCSFAQGGNSTATGAHSFSVGGHATGDYSTAIRGNALGDYSISIGGQAYGEAAISIGSGSGTEGDETITIGKWITSHASSSTNYTMGKGVDDTYHLLNDISNSIMFGVNSTLPTLYIESASGTGTWGNVGIGTTSPAGLLHIRGESGEDTHFRVDIQNSRSGGMYFYNNSTPRGNLVIDNSNNMWMFNSTSAADVTIGVTPTSGSTPQAITIKGNTANVGIGTATISARLHVTAHEDGDENIAKFSVSDVDNTQEYLQFKNKDADDDQFSAMILGRSEVTDNEVLTIRGISNDDSGTKSVMVFDVRDDGGDPITMRPLFRWENAGTHQMLMNKDGNLGINTLSPSGKLHVHGGMFLSSLGTPGGSNDHFIGVNLNNNEVIDLGTSTIEFKENVEDLDFDKQAFLNLRPVDFTWKSACGGGDDVGLIAQEVDQIFPDLATYGHKRTYYSDGSMLLDSLGIPAVDTTQMEVRGVKYHKLPVYLLALVKEQQESIDLLQGQVQQLIDIVNSCCEVQSSSRLINPNAEEGLELSDRVEELILLKNDPNPFTDYTDIHYNYDGCSNCEIIISDIYGSVVRRIKIMNKEGVLRVYSSELGTGTFIYSLVKNGNTLRSEKMISSKY